MLIQGYAGGSKILGPVETYSWHQSQHDPYLNYKGPNWAVQDRIIFKGAQECVPKNIFIAVEVDHKAVGGVRIANGDGVIAVNENIVNTEWDLVSLGDLSNLSDGPALWDVQVKTNSASKEIRVSSMIIVY